MSLFSTKTRVAESATAIVPDPPVPPAPVSIDAELAQEERLAYAKLAEELAFHPAALRLEKLRGYLASRKSLVYPYRKVKEYLDQKFGAKDLHEGWSHTWGWCPLRESDMGKSDLPAFGTASTNSLYSADNGQFIFGRTYHGAVPFPTLSLVKEIAESVPGVHFFVSDAMKPRDRAGRDPFLGVSTPGTEEMIIIAEWDEPSFR